jgi:hypothetical protein
MDLSRESLLKARYVLGEMEAERTRRALLGAMPFAFADGTFDKIVSVRK